MNPRMRDWAIWRSFKAELEWPVQLILFSSTIILILHVPKKQAMNALIK